MGGLGDMLVAQTGLFLRGLGPARFERRPTVVQSLEILVGRRGETPLSTPYLENGDGHRQPHTPNCILPAQSITSRST